MTVDVRTENTLAQITSARKEMEQQHVKYLERDLTWGKDIESNCSKTWVSGWNDYNYETG